MAKRAVSKPSQSSMLRRPGQGCPCRRRLPWHLIELGWTGPGYFEHQCQCGRVWRAEPDGKSVHLERCS